MVGPISVLELHQSISLQIWKWPCLLGLQTVSSEPPSLWFPKSVAPGWEGGVWK